MITVDVTDKTPQTINELIAGASEPLTLTGVLGQRFIAAGAKTGEITVSGIPGNALGAYLDGATVTVPANAQDAVGDTMNEGRITVGGRVGDTVGYAMRGGEIYVRSDAGYRAGIHMKAYREKCPVLVIGGCAGSFLGEYQAGGIILVLALAGGTPVGSFPFTGMHGGEAYLRGDLSSVVFPEGVTVTPVSGDALDRIRPYLETYARLFGADVKTIENAPFVRVTPKTDSPYRQMYAAN